MRKPEGPNHADERRNREKRWMAAYQKDDPRAFQSIYAAYADSVYGYLVKRVRDPAEREDLFQAVWMKFHRSRDQWSSEYSLLQWLFVISRSVVIDRFRERKHSPQGHLTPDENVLERLVAPQPLEAANAERNAEESELTEMLRSEGLSSDQVEVIRDHLFEEAHYEEIARRLGKSELSVRKIFSRGIQKLRRSAWGKAQAERHQATSKKGEIGG